MSDKAAERKNILENLIGEYITNWHTLAQPTKAHLEIVAKNWEEAKKHIKTFIKKRYSPEGIIKELRKEFGVEFDKEEARQIYDEMILEAGQIHDKKFLRGVDLLKDVPSIAKALNVPLEDSQIKELWDSFFNGEWTRFDLESIVEKLGTPKLTKEEVSSICNDCLRGWAGEKPLKKRSYKKCPQEEDLIAFLNVSPFNPEWSRVEAEKACDSLVPFLTSCYSQKEFVLLRDRIGVTPSPEKVRELYRKLFSQEKENDYRGYENAEKVAKEFESAFRITGIKLERKDRKLVAKFYRDNLELRNLESIRKIENLTGIPCDSETINLVYADRLKEGNIGGINNLRERIEVEPNFKQEDIQEAYALLFKKGELDSALRIYLFTDTEPRVDTTIAQQAYEALEGKLDFDKNAGNFDSQALCWMHERYPEQSTQFAKQQVRRLCKEGKFGIAEKLVAILNISPEPEEAYVLACKKGDWKSAKSLFEENGKTITEAYPDYAELSKYI